MDHAEVVRELHRGADGRKQFQPLPRLQPHLVAVDIESACRE